MNSEKKTEAVDTNVDTQVDTNVDTAQRFARIHTGWKEERGGDWTKRRDRELRASTQVSGLFGGVRGI